MNNKGNVKKQNKFVFSEWVIDLFKDEKGEPSIKPVIAFIGCMFLCISMVINAVVPQSFTPSDSLVEAIMIITAIGMGADSLDKFSTKRRLMGSSRYSNTYEQTGYEHDSSEERYGGDTSTRRSGTTKNQDEIL